MSATRKYVYVESYGMIYRFTQRNWLRVLKEVAADRNVDYGHYGRMMLVVSHNITDIDQEQAQDMLNDLKAEEVTR